jgi:DNA polymerase IV
MFDRKGKNIYDDSMKRKQDILLCDLDAFFASVEQRDNPELRGKPVIVGGSPEGRGVVSTCSYETRKFGVRSAMPVKKALVLCPQAIVLRSRMSRYKEISLQVREVFLQHTPDIEIVSIDEAYLALPEGKGLVIGETIHRQVKEELALPISVGVSVNKLLAKIACELAKPDRVGTLWPEEVPEKLWPLPIRALPGIGPAAEQTLHRRGIQTVKNLADAPPQTLKDLFGKNIDAIHQFALGLDSRELQPEKEAKSISEETTFPEDISNRDIMTAVILELSEGVGHRLRSAGLTARTITLKLRYSDFRTITRGKTVTDSMNSDSEIYHLARELFFKHCGKPPWRLVGLQASGFEHGSQLSIEDTAPAAQKEKTLLATKDLLRKKFGGTALFQAKRLIIKEKDDH